MHARVPNPSSRSGFTLLELMVGMTILLILMGIIFTITHQTGDLWKKTNSKIASFQDARAAFDALTRNLSQATLNQYYDYYDASWNRRDPAVSGFVPQNYGRCSELEFVCGPVDTLLGAPAGAKQSHALFFQAPLGRAENKTLYAESSNLLNSVGYYVEFADTTKDTRRPKFLPSSGAPERGRFRLMEWIQPAEQFSVYDPALSASQPRAWFRTPLSTGQSARVMAENILALVAFPKKDQNDTSLAPNYFYDSNPKNDSDPSNYDSVRSHLLPPLLQVTMVALDRDSADRLAKSGPQPPPLLDANLFRDASKYNADLQKLEDVLNGKNGGPKLNYRIFTTMVSIRDHK